MGLGGKGERKKWKARQGKGYRLKAVIVNNFYKTSLLKAMKMKVWTGNKKTDNGRFFLFFFICFLIKIYTTSFF